MKINKSKLKSMVEKRGPVVPVGIKRKRVDEGQPSIISEPSVPFLKRAPTSQASPSSPPQPLIIQILNEEIAVVQATDDGPTICRSHGLAAKRAEAVITELNFQEYANARTENISKLMVHSLMRVGKAFLFFFIRHFLFIIYLDLSSICSSSISERGDGDQPLLPFCGRQPSLSEAEAG